VERNSSKINKKSLDCLKKNEKRQKIFYKLKKLKKGKSKKIILVKFVPKRSAPKWTSNKMGNVKKGQTGCAKVVAP